MEQLNIAIIGGDLRQVYLAEMLALEGHNCTSFGLMASPTENGVRKATDIKAAMTNADYIIGPVPFSRNQKDMYAEQEEVDLKLESFMSFLNTGHMLFGGNITKNVKEYCRIHEIQYYDFMEIETVSIENAIATAEGSIVEAIKASPINLHHSKCLVIGYGRCAKILADKLKSLSALVTVAARNCDQLSLAYASGLSSISLENIDSLLPSFDFIFNTVPAMIVTKERLQCVSKQAVIIDIASKPGGTDFNAAKEYGICAKLCLGLPGLYAPKASAEILAKAFLTIVEGRCSY